MNNNIYIFGKKHPEAKEITLSKERLNQIKENIKKLLKK